MKKKNLVIVLLALAMIFVVGKETYAYYISKTEVNVKATSSNIICDAVIAEVSKEEKSKFGYSEFKVIVKNYDSSNTVTKEPLNYTLTIENNGSNGLFGYNNNFNSSLEFNDSMQSGSKEDKSYIIAVKGNNGLSENVNYKVKLNCSQKN